MVRALVLAAGIAGGFMAAVAALRVGRRILWRPPHVRENYRGRPVAGTLGAVLLAALTTGAAGAVVWASLSGREVRVALVALSAGAAMAVLGLVDDLRARTSGGGLRGHLRTLRRGELTTGALKAGGGAVVGLGAAWVLGWRGGWVVVGGAVVAMSANLVNLLDRRPGRACKVWLAAWAGAVVAVPLDAVLSSAGLAGGVLAFLPSDLRERGMLGDVGANLLGAVWGVLAVSSFGRVGLAVCAGALAVLTLASEAVSFSEVIDRVAPLRALDRIGRRDV